jgi:hypothetical protein
MDNDTRDYVGEYFMAVYEGSTSTGFNFRIYQISPVVYLATTDRREIAIELVNRLDVTGDTLVGIGDDDNE